MYSGENLAPIPELMEKARDLLCREGKRSFVSANRPLHLDEEESAWLVASGRIDVFSVPMEDTTVCGPRSHLCRVEAGLLLFAIPRQGNGRSEAFLGVPGPHTEVVKINTSRLRELAPTADFVEPLCRMIDRWVSAVSAGVSTGNPPPKDAVNLEPGRELASEAGDVLRVTQGLLWVSLTEGRARFMDTLDSQAIEKGQIIPVCNATWIRAEQNTKVQSHTTQELLGNGDSLWNGLRAFHRLAPKLTRLKRSKTEDRARQRLSARALADQRLTENTRESLSAVLIKKRGVVDEVEGDPLLSACRMVGDALAMEIRAPSRQDAPTDREDSLEAIVRASRARAREVLLNGRWWREDNGPLLGYLGEEQRPVALLPDGPKKYVLHDPVDRSKTSVDEAVAARLQPQAHVLYKPFPSRPLTGKDLIRFGLQGCRPDLWRILLMGSAGGLLSLIFPIATGLLYQTIIPSGNRIQLAQMIAGMIVGAFCAGIFVFVQALAQLRIAGRAGSRIEAAIWDRLLNLPAGFFRRFTAGDLANRALGINRIQRLLSSAAVSSCVAGIFSIFNLALLFYYGGNLAYPAIGIILLSLVFATVCLVLQLKYQRTLFDVIGSIQSLTLQFIKGVGKLRVGGAEIRALHKWAGKYARQKELDLKTRYVTNTVGVFSSSMPLVASLIIFGWLALSRDQALISMGAGQFLGFNAAFTTILTAIFTTMIFLFPMLQVVPLFERTRPLLQEIPELEAGKAEPADLTGAIEAAHLFFRYAPDAPMVLKDVSLHVNPGEFAAVVGPSGSGKSTFFRLLLGFETPQSGSIYFDGRDLAGLDIQAVRRQMGVVVQTGKLQPGSIFQNIVGATRLTLDDAWEAARMAALDKDIEAMPMGMHTFIGEDGAGLSGGQQQRLLIARAVVRKPRILLFDEATSALDNESQAVVSKSLKDLQSTRIVIAHRLSTIKSADRIFVLVAGEIVETGRYEELMALNGEFAELARRQIA